MTVKAGIAKASIFFTLLRDVQIGMLSVDGKIGSAGAVDPAWDGKGNFMW